MADNTEAKEFYNMMLLLDTYKKHPKLYDGTKFRSHLSPTMFKHVNQFGFKIVTHFLLSIIEPDECKKLPWPIFDKRQETEYRKKVKAILDALNVKHEWGLPFIHTSHMISPFGRRIMKLMFLLARTAVIIVSESEDELNLLPMTPAHDANQQLVQIETLSPLTDDSDQSVEKEMLLNMISSAKNISSELHQAMARYNEFETLFKGETTTMLEKLRKLGTDLKESHAFVQSLANQCNILEDNIYSKPTDLSLILHTYTDEIENISVNTENHLRDNIVEVQRTTRMMLDGLKFYKTNFASLYENNTHFHKITNGVCSNLRLQSESNRVPMQDDLTFSSFLAGGNNRFAQNLGVSSVSNNNFKDNFIDDEFLQDEAAALPSFIISNADTDNDIQN